MAVDVQRTFFFDKALLPSGWARNVQIEVNHGVIESVAADVTPLGAAVRFAVVVPGMPNVHSHAFQRAMAGLSEQLGPTGTDDFWSWREVMYHFLSRLDADDVEAIAAYAYADMLEAGFTSVGEFHYLHGAPDGGRYQQPAELALRHLAAADTTGIGLTLLPVFYEASQFGGVPPTDGQRRFINNPATFGQIVAEIASHMTLSPHRNVGIAPHSLRAVTAAHLHELVGQFGAGPIHIHAAEQMKEVQDCMSFYGLRPVEWLLRNTTIDDRWCVVHATHMTDRETIELAASGAVAGICPITEANLGDGIFPAVGYLQGNGRLGIGTDSNIALDAAGELRQLEYSQRLQSQTRNALASRTQPATSRRLYDSALAGGAQALRLPVGALSAGSRADFVALDDGHPDLTGRDPDTVLATWIFTAGRQAIRQVVAGGEIVVEQRRHRARDRIDAAYRGVMQRLLIA
jgi:formimidoylglutamate deiminase